MHHLTRSTLAASTLILAAGVAVAIASSSGPAPTPTTQRPVVQQPANPIQHEDPALTQRRGEWAPLCATTNNPLVDFSPVDRGSGRHRILITVHNCSGEQVTLDQEPFIWFGGREMMAEYLRPDPERTDLRPLTLEPRESAQAVLSWESFGAPDPDGVQVGTLSVRVPGIGEGEVQDPDLVGLTPTARAWLSGWTR